MSEFLDLVKKRRSIRNFTEQKIERKYLEMCVEAARHAPSACNVQPWKFIIIDDPQKIKSIADTIFAGPYNMNIFARQAAAFIIIVSENQKLVPRLGEIIRKTNYRLLDIGMACEHILLQATELGIGTCILGWFNEKKLKKLSSIPRPKKAELVIALGYTTEAGVKKRPLKDISEVMAFDKY